MKIEAKQRLLSWTPNTINKTGLWRSATTPELIQKVLDQEGYVQTKDRVAGFLVYEGTGPSIGDYWLVDPARKRAIAYISVSPFGKIHQIPLSVVNPAFVGKGIGFKMYEFLLKKYGALRCDNELSLGASLLWAALIQKHSGYIQLLHNNERLQIPIEGFKKDDEGFVWPIIKRDGKKVSISDLRTSPDRNERAAVRNFTYVATW